MLSPLDETSQEQAHNQQGPLHKLRVHIMIIECIHPHPLEFSNSFFGSPLTLLKKNKSQYAFAIDPQMVHLSFIEKNFINLLNQLSK